jgi:hypothetical protein
MRISVRKQLLVLLALGALLTAAPAAVSTRPTAAQCQSNCLQVFSIKMYNYVSADAQANVQIVDENGSLIRGAVVHGVWTLPDGTTVEQYANIGTRGRAEFRLYTDQSGTVTLTVVDAALAGYAFDPAGSNLLSASIDIAGSVPPPDPGVCTTGCLTVNSIDMSSRGRMVRGFALVLDENGSSVSGVSVDATWTLPDGSTVGQTLSTNRRGQARLSVPVAGSGDYTVAVNDATLAGYTFVVDGSVLTATYTVN